MYIMKLPFVLMVMVPYCGAVPSAAVNGSPSASVSLVKSDVLPSAVVVAVPARYKNGTVTATGGLLMYMVTLVVFPLIKPSIAR